MSGPYCKNLIANSVATEKECVKLSLEISVSINRVKAGERSLDPAIADLRQKRVMSAKDQQKAGTSTNIK